MRFEYPGSTPARGAKRRVALLIVGTFATNACAVPAHMRSAKLEAEYHFVAETGCPRYEVETRALGDMNFETRGCGQTRVYDCAYLNGSGTGRLAHHGRYVCAGQPGAPRTTIDEPSPDAAPWK